MEDGQCKALFVLHCNSSPQLQGYPCHSSVWRSSSLLHMQHAPPQHLANKGTQPLFKTKETSIAFDIFTLHHYKEILFGLKEVCSISDGHLCSSLAHWPFRAPLWRCTGKRKGVLRCCLSQMLPFRPCCFIRDQVSEQTRWAWRHPHSVGFLGRPQMSCDCRQGY